MLFTISNATEYVYLEAELISGTIYFRCSATGVDGTFVAMFSAAQTTFFTTTPNAVGIGGYSANGGVPAVLTFDWFRDYTNGYAPSTGTGSTAALVATQIGFGSAGNLLTGSASFTFDASGGSGTLASIGPPPGYGGQAALTLKGYSPAPVGSLALKITTALTTDSPYIQFPAGFVGYSGTADALVIGSHPGDFIVGAQNGSNLLLTTVATAPVVTITTGSRVAIGPVGGVSDSLFWVYGGSLGGIRCCYNGTSVNYYDADTHNIRNGAGTALVTITAGAAGVKFNAYGAGTATFSAAGVITAVSDERLKKDIVLYTKGMAVLRGINPITYRWTEESKIDPGMDTEYVGFSAQNVRAHIPLTVGQGEDGYLSFSDRGVTAALVNAVKELQQQIDYLKAPKVKWYTSCIRRLLNGFQ
jgi:hypothetical protein